jgi:hypothetical protein
MEITSKDLVFASLMGIENVEKLQKLALVQNENQKHVAYKLPFLPFLNKVGVKSSSKEKPDFNLNGSASATAKDQQFFPLSFSFSESGPKWLFPFEPMITISSGNNVIMRNVAKQGDGFVGTIKERWSRRDFEITVTGLLMGSVESGKVDDCYPKAQMLQLFDYLTYSKEIYVQSEPLELLGINKAVVLEYSFPFTKGENVQAYEIKLVSDHSYQLLVEDKPLSYV